MPRLFVALEVPESVSAALCALRADLPGACWMTQYHLTLRFLGDVNTPQVEPLRTALAGVQGPPLRVRGRGLDVLPSRRRPCVLVVHAERTAPLAELHQEVEAAAQRLDLAPDRRSFRPHVTVARLKRTPLGPLRAYLRAHADVRFDFTAAAFHLYESTLRPEGAVYAKQAAFALRAPS